MPRDTLPLPSTAYLFRYGITPQRHIALVVMDGTTPVVMAQVTY
jgi:hypothetical protein